MRKERWTIDHIPEQTGRIVIVTGANSGLGYNTTRALASKGALPTLYAATANDVNQGAFYGPGGFMKLRGWPVADSPSKKLVTDEVAGKLWDVSESLTGIEFRV